MRCSNMVAIKKENKLAEPLVQSLFLILSVYSAVLPAESYLNYPAWENLFLTNIINVVIVVLYLLARFMLRKRNPVENLQKAMLLYIIYNCPPIFVFVSSPVTRILSTLCFFGSLIVFILKNKSSNNISVVSELSKSFRVVLGALLLLFGIGFIFRGVGVIYQYVSGGSELADMLVSVSDIIICVIWGTVAIQFIMNRTYGNSNVLACYMQASLLFIGLILFLIINPLLIEAQTDIEAVIVIVGMSLFFFIPTIILLRKIGV
jgi:hypothetical protein